MNLKTLTYDCFISRCIGISLSKFTGADPEFTLFFSISNGKSLFNALIWGLSTIFEKAPDSSYLFLEYAGN